jgi:hypothetical protein
MHTSATQARPVPQSLVDVQDSPALPRRMSSQAELHTQHNPIALTQNT